MFRIYICTQLDVSRYYDYDYCTLHGVANAHDGMFLKARALVHDDKRNAPADATHTHTFQIVFKTHSTHTHIFMLCAERNCLLWSRDVDRQIRVYTRDRHIVSGRIG